MLELDAIYREVVVMRFFDDLPPREIARRLGLPGATVRKRLSRALVQVEVLLGERLADEDMEWRPTLSALAGSTGRALPSGALPLARRRLLVVPSADLMQLPRAAFAPGVLELEGEVLVLSRARR